MTGIQQKLATGRGKFTTDYPDLGVGPVNYEDSISEEFFAAERKAVFERSWLCVGRSERLPRKGSYFTRELPGRLASIVITRDLDDNVYAFHNICAHRGNKVVWQEHPMEESSGSCRAFSCKYHGWRYGLNGVVNHITNEEEFFDLDKSKLRMPPVHCEVWAGFIFVNLDRDQACGSLREFLGPMVGALEGYPFDQVTERFSFTAEIPANWKVFVDTLQEQYHAPIVHRNQRPETFDAPMQVYGFEAPHYQLDGPHRMLTTPGILPWNLPDDQVKPTERLIRSGLFGPWDAPDLGALPAGMNPGGCDPWGISLFLVFPNFGIQFWERGWYHTYHHWPTSPGILPWNLPDDQVKPMERMIRSGLFGPWDAPDLGAVREALRHQVERIAVERSQHRAEEVAQRLAR